MNWSSPCRFALTFLLIVGCASTPAPVALDAGSNPTFRSGEVVERPDLGFRYHLPDSGLERVERLENEGVALGVSSPGGSVHHVIVSEGLAIPVDAETAARTLPRSMLSRMQGSYPSAEIASADFEPLTINGIDGHQVHTVFDLGGARQTVLSWIVVRGTRVHTLNSFTATTQVDLRSEAMLFFEGFEPLADGGAVMRASSVRRYDSDAYGYAVDYPPAWDEWEDLDNLVVDAALIRRGELCFAAMVPFRRGDVQVGVAALREMFMGQFGFGDAGERLRSRREDDGTVLLSGQAEIDGGDWAVRAAIVTQGGLDLFVLTWSLTEAAQADALFEEIRASIRFTGREGLLDPAEKSAQSTLWVGLGMHYSERSSAQRALDCMQRATDLVPASSEMLVLASGILNPLCEGQDCVDWFEPRLAKVAAPTPELLSWHAWFLLGAGRVEESVDAYGSIFDAGFRSDEDFEAYMLALQQLGRFDELDRRYEEYVAADVPVLRNRYATLLAAQGRPDDGLAILDAAEDAGYFDPEALFARLEVYESGGRWGDVLDTTQQLIDEGYDSAVVQNWRGSAQFALNRHREAKESFLRSLELAPGNEFATGFLGEIDHFLGEDDNRFARTPVDPVPLPDDLAAAFAAARVAPLTQGDDSIDLFLVTAHDLDEENVLRETRYVVTDVLERGDVDHLSTIPFFFEPASQSLYVNELQVLDSGGAVIAEGDVSTYYVADDVDANTRVAGDGKTLYVPVPGLRVGTRLVYVQTQVTRGGEDGMAYDLEFLGSPRRGRLLGGTMTGSLDDLHLAHHSAVEVVQTADRWTWNAEALRDAAWEPYMPPYTEVAPWVRLGTARESWEVVGRGYLENLVEVLAAPSGFDVQAVVGDATEGVDVLRRLVAAIHERTTYKALAFGRRAFVPAPAPTTLAKGYGDCKDFSVLLHRFLTEVGIASQLVLVHTAFPVDPDVPNLDQFDHMIVRVELEDGPHFVDPTDEFTDPATVSRSLGLTKYGLALADTPAIIAIDGPSVSSFVLDAEARVTDGEDVTVREVATVHGPMAAVLRAYFASFASSDTWAMTQGMLASELPEAELVDVVVDHLHEPGAPLRVVLEHRTRRAVSDGGSTVTVPQFFLRYVLLPPPVQERHMPVDLRPGTDVRSSTWVEGAYQVTLGAAAQRSGPAAEWSAQTRSADDGMRIESAWRMAPAIHPAAVYMPFRRATSDAIAAVEGPFTIRRPGS